jgi:anaerobic sulfite reductase subunit B
VAPLRLSIIDAMEHHQRFASLTVVAAARTPADLLYPGELERWSRDERLEVRVTVDAAGPGWTGPVGLVTDALATVPIDPRTVVALVCGPEPMMIAVAHDLVTRGVEPHRIHVSLERNMRCGVGTCGHCQLGPLFVCRDGPVFAYDRVAHLLEVREL